ncbi:MAG TPA: hypothetical protein PLV56_00285 [Synergistales bacterium]|nr:hypothetical protein [Synergistales bacterium]
MDYRMMKILMDKPEIAGSLPSWMISRETLEKMKKETAPAMIEIAGRDSIAAAIEALSLENITAFFPTIVYSGTQFGDWDTPFEAIEVLKGHPRVKGNVRIYPPAVTGSPSFWWNLCGRHNYSLLDDFGFYTPCIGCHLYFHAMRIPLAIELGCRTLIAGERESHDGRIKLNQLGISLNAYIRLFEEFGMKFLMPLRNIGKGSDITQILGDEWKEGENQLKCVLSKNYVGKNEQVVYNENSIKRYFNEFALPMTREWLKDKTGMEPARI